MEECIFCSIIDQADKEVCSKIENKILYEDDLVLVKPALGMSISNYLMIISKKHINGFAELSSYDLNRLEKLLNIICEEYLRVIGTCPILFEHGSLPEGRHPASITHAHIHVIPIKLTPDRIVRLFDELKLVIKSDITALKEVKYKDYWMYRNEGKNYFVSHSVKEAPRSCFIKIVAEQAGYDNSYEWRNPNNNRLSEVKKTIETFRKLKLDKVD